MIPLLVAAFLSFSAHAQSDDVPMLPAPTATPSDSVSKASPLKAPEPKVKTKPVVSSASGGTGVVSITKVVGEVDNQYVTSREVKINSAIDQAINQKPSSADDGYKILTGAERSFPSEVGRVLDEWAVFFEARSLGSTAVQKSDVAKAIGVVQERWSGSQAWHDLEVGTEELRKAVEMKLAAQNFQKLKSDPALSPVSDDEALSYYKKNRLRFGSLPFSSFQDNIKAFLVKSQVEKRLIEWHDVLRRKYKTRNFISG
jgi:hypothetical protein